MVVFVVILVQPDPVQCSMLPFVPTANTLDGDNVILRLRRKLPNPDSLETVRGVGFRLA